MFYSVLKIWKYGAKKFDDNGIYYSKKTLTYYFIVDIRICGMNEQDYKLIITICGNLLLKCFSMLNPYKTIFQIPPLYTLCRNIQ